ncbi:MAG: 16S rRNA (cytosine1402-N4)-methyltransferase [Parcubacteria group bacterium Gr01-1014_8]|nr:MAG: 16S rRNA (cytosine1402-N4)-methyltransferase [Parcubacteria group bacterium Gr01-1014_8]
MRTRRSASSSSDPVPSRRGSNSDTHVLEGKSQRHHKSTSIFLSPSTDKKNWSHRSVLLHESIAALNVKPSHVVVDATLGGAGHAKAIVEKLDANGVFIGLDADAAAVERARTTLSAAACRIHIATANFRTLDEVLHNCGVTGVNSCLFDLGWSGYQLAAGRGFSFLTDEPLLMTYARDILPDTLTAEKIVNDWEEESIADVLYGWGEERYSRRIAKRIALYRKTKRIQTSKELGEIISSAVPLHYRKGRLHPATKTFQALRIAVNDELGALKEGLQAAWKTLLTGGRLVVISFHSVEDREVKRLMMEWYRAGEAERITKSPIRPSREEMTENPRSRSAKLRVIQKI